MLPSMGPTPPYARAPPALRSSSLSLDARSLHEVAVTEPRSLHRSANVGDNAPNPAPMPYLVVREPGQVSYTLPLREGLRMGRHEQNDVVLDDHQVSRYHARFTRS